MPILVVRCCEKALWHSIALKQSWTRSRAPGPRYQIPISEGVKNVTWCMLMHTDLFLARGRTSSRVVIYCVATTGNVCDRQLFSNSAPRQVWFFCRALPNMVVNTAKKQTWPNIYLSKVQASHIATFAVLMSIGNIVCGNRRSLGICANMIWLLVISQCSVIS